MKRVFSIFLCIALCFGLCVPVFAHDMNDVFATQAYLTIAAGLIAAKFSAKWVPIVVEITSVATPMLWIHEDIWEMENIYTYVYGVYN